MTHIGPGITIVGDVQCDTEDLRIDGLVRGRVRGAEGTVIIGPDARVEGDVRAANVLVQGRVNGSIWGRERVELAASATVEGSISANRLLIPDGAVVTARIDMDRRTIAAAVARYRAQAPAAG